MTINNNNIFGAFTLNEARGSRLTGDWLNKESVANYGWFGGGALPGVSATVDRINFSNDSVTALARGSLSQARYGLVATGNSNYGWFGGGYSIPALYRTTVDRIDFSNDSSIASPRGPLSLARSNSAATGNSNYGWFGGGFITGAAIRSTVDRIDFSNDSSTASLRGSLSLARYSIGTTGNSNYGWFGGAFVSIAPVSTVDRIDFSNDFAIASPRGPLSSAKSLSAATGNSNYGWFGSGNTPGGTITTVDRIDFSNDSSTASVRSPLTVTPAAKYIITATGNSDYGWWGGGYDPGTTFAQATVDRINFSNDLVASSPRGSLSLARSSSAATSGVLNIRRQKAGNYGWWGGGVDATPATSAVVDRIDFSNDTGTASLRGSLFQARNNLAATGNSNYGWFGGGSTAFPATPTTQSTRVDRIDFSNDSPAGALSRGTLTLARYGLAATGNSNYGWFGGGGGLPAGTVYSIVDRIDFSNDSSTASVRGSITPATGRNSLAATSNSNYGWFGGGGAPLLSIVDRIDFSNDSSIASPRGLLNAPAGRQGLAATGNSNYGWFGGGATPAAVATVDRIDFSNDSVTASPRGTLSLARLNLAATGNSNYGWFSGGSTASAPVALVSRVDRIDFSNDSVTASVRGSISPATGRYNLAATSNTHIG
jgi:hypothetical protein